MSILKKLSAIGPGIFAIGYTIGTGSVTAMIVAGSQFGMQLLWVLALSCIFSGVLMEAYGRYSLVTGETALFSFRKNLPFGSLIAILIIVGITIGQWNSLIGILGISANAIFEVLSLFIPALADVEYAAVLVIAVVTIGAMYALLWRGSYTIFERLLTVFVSLMGLSFLVANFIVLPDPSALAGGLVPSIPAVEGGTLLVAAFVGTTMAAATFLSRPLFIRGKGWGLAHLGDQRRDAIWAAVLIFVVSGAIMAIATSVLFAEGKVVTKVLDMVYALEPFAGRFAVAIFFVGTLAAGLSSVFPILMIAPLMIADFQAGELDVKSIRFKLIAGMACVISLLVPIFGANPIKAQLVTQVFNVFILPVVIASIAVLVNRQSLMREYRAGIWLNIGLALAFVFACVVSYTGVLALLDAGK